MTDKLETFIEEHIQEFDTVEPAQELWLKISAGMNAKSLIEVKSKLLSKLIYFGLSTMVLVITIIYFALQRSGNTSSLTSNEKRKELILKNTATFTNALIDHSNKGNFKQDQIISRGPISYKVIEKQKTEFPNSDINGNISDPKQDISGVGKKDTLFSNLSRQISNNKDTFKIIRIYNTYPNKLFWCTVNEVSQMPFVVEQFYWNRWVKVGKVPCKGNTAWNRYMLKVPLYSGENIFRIVQINDSNAYVYISREIKWTSDKPKVNYAVKKRNKEIWFSDVTFFEILDSTGIVVKKGRGKAVSYNNLPEGAYVLNYDNSTAIFKRK